MKAVLCRMLDISENPRKVYVDMEFIQYWGRLKAIFGK
jgi:hypothetical protein